MRTDQQLKDTYKVIIDEDNKIIELRYLEPITDKGENIRQSELIEEEGQKIFKKNPGQKYNILVNLSPIKRVEFTAKKSRKVYIRLASHKQIKKMAVVGGDIFVQAVATFIFRAAGKGKEIIRVFDSVDKAIDWLRYKKEE